MNTGQNPLHNSFSDNDQAAGQDKVVITVVGKDRVGIIAAVTGLLADHGVNIEDITQKILGEYFTMILVGDVSNSDLSPGLLRERLIDRGREIGVDVYLQHAAVFRAMHRI
ncbi:MAG TPA: ACT domain-containing protein [Atribacteraceae bacterium]|nr:ACT domain-containing protein [Atribacteraceae bacterium]